jgi:hypothetical protein
MRKRFWAISLVVLFVAGFAFYGMLSPASALAGDVNGDREQQILIGLMGLSPGQTIRINVVNVDNPDYLPPGPCLVRHAFVDSNGKFLAAPEVTRLLPGESASRELDFIPIDEAGARQRHSLRPHIGFVDDPNIRNCANAIWSVEVYNQQTGETSTFVHPATARLGPSSHMK